jgi:sporulation protein YlmC with PRC-barrel domain
MNRTVIPAMACSLFAATATAQKEPQEPPAPRSTTDRTSTLNADQDQDAARVEGRACRVTKLLGADVKNSSGEKMGEVKDLVIDKEDERIVLAIVGFDGLLGTKERLFAVPFMACKSAADQSHLVLDVTKDQLTKAPNFESKSWPQFDRRYDTAIYDYYQVAPYWAAKSVKARPSGEPSSSNRDPDAAPAAAAPRRTVRASKWIGTDVEDPQGKDLGDVDDVVVDDPSGRVVYAVLSFGGFLGMGDKLFAIPWGALKPSLKDEKKLVLDVAKERLKSAPGFDKKNWPNMADRRWGLDVHHYYGLEPYWNRNDRGDDTRRDGSTRKPDGR